MEQRALIQREDVNVATGTKIRLELPWPPSANHYTGQRVQLPGAGDMEKQLAEFNGDFRELRKWIQAKSFVQTYPTSATKEFMVAVWSIVNKTKGAKKHWRGEIRMSMYIHPPDRRKRDNSNLWKCVEDALVGAGVMDDDHQIIKHYDERMNPVKGGLVVVELELLVD